MTNNEKDDIVQKFFDGLPSDISDEEIVDAIKNVEDSEIRGLITEIECDTIIDYIVYEMFGWGYPDNIVFSELDMIQKIFIPLQIFIPEESKMYYDAVTAFFNGNKEKCFNLLKNQIDKYVENDGTLDEFWFAYSYLIFKGAIPELYDYILEKISSSKCEKGLPELIKAAKTYYCTSDDVKLEEAASAALLVVPNSLLAKELMAVAWYNTKRWNNTIAILENIEKGYIWSDSNKLFSLAWCKSKIRDRKSAIEYYKKCLEINPVKMWARNNLAYEYFATKQYQKAEKIYYNFIKDFDNKFDDKYELKYVCTGYVRTLSALSKYDKAEKFIKKSPEKIYKYALDELKSAKNGDKKYISDERFEKETVFENRIVEHKSTSQFSKESILEDELTERLSSGTAVFGIPMKIFERKGIYGRQWTFDFGRIDLLAEDDEGNLYVIELKKDSGYDDAYMQTVKYVESLEKTKYAKDKKVYGIICVNDPPENLVKSVRSDKRIRLFEYQISYSEIL